jgi:hypothetical protein
MLRLTLAAALGLALAACGREQASAPGGVTPAEAEALENAADMLEQRRIPPEAVVSEAAPSAAPSVAPAEMTGDPAPSGG